MSTKLTNICIVSLRPLCGLFRRIVCVCVFHSAFVCPECCWFTHDQNIRTNNRLHLPYSRLRIHSMCVCVCACVFLCSLVPRSLSPLPLFDSSGSVAWMHTQNIRARVEGLAPPSLCLPHRVAWKENRLGLRCTNRQSKTMIRRQTRFILQ